VWEALRTKTSKVVTRVRPRSSRYEAGENASWMLGDSEGGGGWAVGDADNMAAQNECIAEKSCDEGETSELPFNKAE
jgi:hypothetical protein